MRNFCILALLTSMVFFIPVAVFSMDAVPEMDNGVATNQTPNENAMNVDVPQDERIQSLEKEFSDTLNDLLTQIRNQTECGYRL